MAKRLSSPTYRLALPNEQDPRAEAWGFRSAWIESGRIRLHCVEAGPQTGEPLIFLHGFPEFWFSWRHQLKALSAQYRCIALDLRGYHRSDKPVGREAYTIPELLRDLDDTLDALGLEKATWVAHDWGAVLAWAYAGERPDRVRRLAVLNMPHPALFRRGLWRWRQLRRSSYIFFFQLPWLPEWVLSRSSYAAIGRAFSSMLIDRASMTDSDLQAFRDSAAVPGALTAMLNYYRNVFNVRTVFRRFKRIEGPVGILWGTEDRALGEELLVGTERYAPLVSIHKLRACSHWIQQERPDEVNAWLKDWLATTP